MGKIKAADPAKTTPSREKLVTTIGEEGVNWSVLFLTAEVFKKLAENQRR